MIYDEIWGIVVRRIARMESGVNDTNWMSGWVCSKWVGSGYLCILCVYLLYIVRLLDIVKLLYFVRLCMCMCILSIL